MPDWKVEVAAVPPTFKTPPIVDEAFVLRPESNTARPLKAEVDEALKTPATVRVPLAVEDAAVVPTRKLLIDVVGAR